jgi:LmbE family N-acetylglucosaminyl deacetylase
MVVAMSLEEEVRLLAQREGPENALRKIALEIFPDISSPFEETSNVLCIQPHPDDCEYGCGATLAYLADKGIKVTYLTLTDGSKGTTNPSITPGELALTRKKEQEEAGQVIGVSKIYWLDYPDGELPYTREAMCRVMEVIRREKPDIVFAPDPWLLYEPHPDHRIGGLLASEASLFSSLPHFCRGTPPHAIKRMIFYYTSKPNYFQPADDLIEKKLQALRKHRSQFEESWQLLELSIRLIMAAYGTKINAKYAEPLRVIPLTIMHATLLSELI